MKEKNGEPKPQNSRQRHIASRIIQNGRGLFEKDGVIQEDTACLKVDKIFLSFFRGLLRPDEIVRIYKESVCRVERGMPEEMAFITVISLEREKAYPLPVPLGMLYLPDHDRLEIKRDRHLPDWLFDKVPVAMDSYFRMELCPDSEEEDIVIEM